MRRFVFLVPLVFVGCSAASPRPQRASAEAPRPSATGPVVVPLPPPATYSAGLRWVLGSAESRAIAVQTYRAALAAAARLSEGKPKGSWAISVDADDTILDNAPYQKELEAAHSSHSDAAWKRWLQKHERPAVPGAATFLEGVRKLGGRVAVVTNTTESLCGDVAANLDARSLPYDVLVCRAEGEGDRKEGRWRRVAEGSVRPDLGPLELLVWVGDNIQDFPDQSQALSTAGEPAFADFGVRFFALPNPVYGSWEKNPVK